MIDVSIIELLHGMLLLHVKFNFNSSKCEIWYWSPCQCSFCWTQRPTHIILELFTWRIVNAQKLKRRLAYCIRNVLNCVSPHDTSITTWTELISSAHPWTSLVILILLPILARSFEHVHFLIICLVSILSDLSVFNEPFFFDFRDICNSLGFKQNFGYLRSIFKAS